MSNCANALRLAMLPVPRFCPRCGLGPCTAGDGVIDTREKLEAKLARLAELESALGDQAPTQDAYEAACKALAHWREEAKRLGKIAGVEPREMTNRDTARQ